MAMHGIALAHERSWLHYCEHAATSAWCQSQPHAAVSCSSPAWSVSDCTPVSLQSFVAYTAWRVMKPLPWLVFLRTWDAAPAEHLATVASCHHLPLTQLCSWLAVVNDQCLVLVCVECVLYITLCHTRRGWTAHWLSVRQDESAYHQLSCCCHWTPWLGGRVARTSDSRLAVEGSLPGHDTAWLFISETGDHLWPVNCLGNCNYHLGQLSLVSLWGR